MSRTFPGTVRPLLFQGSLILALFTTRVEAQEPQGPAEEVDPLLHAAADALVALKQRRDAGEAMTPTYVRLLAEYSRREALRAMQLQDSPGSRLPDATHLLDRANLFYRTMPIPCFGPWRTAQRVMAQYYFREAGALLATLDPEFFLAEDLSVMPPEREPSVAALAAPAKDVLDVLRKRADEGEALTPTFLELYCHSSRRLCRFELAGAEDARGRQLAAAAHLQRVKSMSSPGVDISVINSVHPSESAEYHVREAELWVAETAAEGLNANQRTPAVVAARAALVDAAGRAWERLRERMKDGEALTPAFVELLCESSRRLCLAEKLRARDVVARRKAAANHLARMKGIHSFLDERFEKGIDVSRVQVSQAKYFLVEAESWVAEASPR